MKNILVPVDFSELSDNAVQLAKELSDKFNSRVRFLHAVPVAGEVLLDDEGRLIESVSYDLGPIRKDMAEAEKQMSALISGMERYESLLAYGKIEEVILNEMKRNNYDLLIMATHGAAGLKGAIIGSHTEHIAMQSKVPVLSLKTTEHVFTDVVYASSFRNSDPPPSAVVNLMNELADKITFLHVLEPGKEGRKDEVEQNMNKQALICGIHNFEKAFHTASDLEQGLEDYCEKNKSGLLVIESKGRRGLNQWISGCISADLVNHYQHALLTFKF